MNSMYDEQLNEDQILVMGEIYKHANFNNNTEARELMRLIRRLQRIADIWGEDKDENGLSQYDDSGKLMMKKFPPIHLRTLELIPQSERDTIADENQEAVSGYVSP